MEKKKTIKSLFLVTGSNVFHLIANILLGLLLPVILTNDNYGYYKIYTLYIGYIGLLHFGFADGIIFQFAGSEYSQLDKRVFRTYTKLFFCVETVCSALTFTMGIILFEGEYQVIAIFVGSYMLIYMMTLYYQFISQATSRFKELATRKTLNSIAIISLVVVSFVLKSKGFWSNIPYWYFLILLQLISLVLLAWYVWTYRDITFGECLPFSKVYCDVAYLCRKGILLTISYEIAQLILQLDRQFVSILYPIDMYAQYAFAYNILACITNLITAISTVMFPMLKRVGREVAAKTLPQGNMFVAMIVCFTFLGSSIVEYLVAMWLPEYAASMLYFKTVFPALAMSCCITINMYTYYKVLDRVKTYLKKSLIALVVAFILNVVAYVVYDTPLAISIASVISVVIWYVLIASNISNQCNVPWAKDFVYLLLMIGIYYSLMLMALNAIMNCAIYLALYCVVTVLFYGKVIRRFVKA